MFHYYLIFSFNKARTDLFLKSYFPNLISYYILLHIWKSILNTAPKFTLCTLIHSSHLLLCSYILLPINKSEKNLILVFCNDDIQKLGGICILYTSLVSKHRSSSCGLPYRVYIMYKLSTFHFNIMPTNSKTWRLLMTEVKELGNWGSHISPLPIGLNHN